MARLLALLQHLAIIAGGVAGLIGYANATFTTHSTFGMAASLCFATFGVIGAFAVLSNDDRLEVSALIGEGGMALVWSMLIFYYLAHDGTGSWQGGFFVGAWGVGLLRSAKKVSDLLNLFS